MKIVLQRVNQAAVKIEGEKYSEIKTGLLILVCVEKNDSEEILRKAAAKIFKMRIFEDEDGRMNRSISEVGGQILAVSQFTLVANMKRGNRPSFENAETPEIAKDFMQKFVDYLRQLKLDVQEGKFGAMMNVELVNHGPVTFVLDF
jgi:D-tyrosyl-tRNA(Tyr) deacylase